MASISEKLVTVAENTPKVHHAGQLNVVQSAQSLKGSESNTAILLDDVSPVTHEMGVRVKSKNLIPFPYRDLKLGMSTYNGVDFTVYEDGSILINGTATSNTTRYLYSNVTDLLGLKSGITISANKNVSDNTQQANVYFICNYYNSAATMQMGIQASTSASGTKTITDDWKGLGIYLHIPSGKTLNNLLIKPQLEIGTTPTAYTPYVPDLTAVKVSRYGKNLLSNLNYIEPKNLSTEIGYSEKIHLKAGLSYTFSIASISNATSWRFMAHIYENGIMVSAGDNNLASNDWFTGNISMYCPKNQNYFMNQANQTVLENITYKITVLKDCEICFGLYLGDTSTATISNNAQLELGTTATEYEPYITPTEYTPTADGTVEDITSLYPNTTLMTDTDGVIIDCEYYKDIDKAYNKLSAAIALSGGE